MEPIKIAEKSFMQFRQRVTIALGSQIAKVRKCRNNPEYAAFDASHCKYLLVLIQGELEELLEEFGAGIKGYDERYVRRQIHLVEKLMSGDAFFPESDFDVLIRAQSMFVTCNSYDFRLGWKYTSQK